MENISKPILLGLKVVLIIVGVFLMYQVLSSYESGWSDLQEATPFFDAESDVYNESRGFMGKLGNMVGFNTFIIGLTVVAVIAFGILGMVKDIRKAIPFLIGAAAMLVIVLIAYYGMSSDVIEPTWETGDAVITKAISKQSDAGIKAVYILLGLSLAGVVYGEVSKLFK